MIFKTFDECVKHLLNSKTIEKAEQTIVPIYVVKDVFLKHPVIGVITDLEEKNKFVEDYCVKTNEYKGIEITQFEINLLTTTIKLV